MDESARKKVLISPTIVAAIKITGKGNAESQMTNQEEEREKNRGAGCIGTRPFLRSQSAFQSNRVNLTTSTDE
jgi:hypothetical protein